MKSIYRILYLIILIVMLLIGCCKKEENLKFKGSINQRIIDVNESLKTNIIKLLD